MPAATCCGHFYWKLFSIGEFLMPLRLVNKQRVHPITICDTVFNIISMTIGEKEQLVHDLQNIDVQVGAFARLLDIISPAIANVKGYEQPTR